MLVGTFRIAWVMLVGLGLGVQGAAAATLNVAAGGVDADGCGTKTAPCRSIGRAIAAASSGDKILVGPGRYGDLDRDGTFGEAGEEPGTDGAVVTIDKTLVVESLAGAATTIIDGAGADFAVIDIAASGTRFGKTGKGFTVTGSSGTGVFVDPVVSGVTVSGVRAVKNGRGFASKARQLVFRGNVAEANIQEGFSISGVGTTITACRATANGTDGFAISGDDHVVKGCVATANGDAGFDLTGNGLTLTKSVGNGNEVGLRVADAADPLLGTNEFLGNDTAGIVVVSPGVTITKTNVFGNGSVGTNCGVTTAAQGAVALDQVCFGAPTGPGDDPADAVCGGNVTVVEFIEKVIKITPKVPL